MEQTTVVEVDNLTKRYGDVVALDHFSLSINKGEIFGLLGPNGCGKTTAISCMLQLLTFENGDIRLFGQPMTPGRNDLKARIGVVPQQVAVIGELTVRENIDCFCSLYIRDKKQRAQLVDEAIAFTGLEHYTKFRPKKLSGGLLRRLNIACGIAHKPELIFFDEPTVAVDPQSRNAILEGIVRLRDEGATVVYTSHYMEEVEQICSRIMIMDAGHMLVQGTADQLKQQIHTGEKIAVETLVAGEPGLPDAVLDEVRALPAVITATFADGELTCACTASPHNLLDVLAVLERHGVNAGHIYVDPPTLNDVFLEITGRALRD